jgi:hypothetical protein
VTAWATVDDVKNLTRIVVTADDIEPAQAIIELFAGTTTEASDRGLLSSLNLRMLRWAVAYQAAWMSQHPDVFTNVDVTQVSQDGVSATLGHENANLVAPLAQRCLRRLSWWNRPLTARRRSGATGEDWQLKRGNRDSVGYDDTAPDWVPT